MGTKIMELKQPEKNIETGRLEILIRFDDIEIDTLNGIVNGYDKGDKDDPKQMAVIDSIKEGFYQARRLVRPSK